MFSFSFTSVFSNVVLSPIVGFFNTLSFVLVDNNSSIDVELKFNNDNPSISSSKIDKEKI
jgi:predicted Zn-dependent protease